MRFSRTRLLTAAQRALDEARARHASRVAEWDAFIERDRSAWLEKNGEKWEDFLHAAGVALRDGRPISHDEVGSTPDKWSTPYRDEQGNTRPNANYDGPAELKQLLAVLAVIEGDEVTTAGLHALGITGSVMTTVSQHLARVSDAEPKAA